MTKKPRIVKTPLLTRAMGRISATILFLIMPAVFFCVAAAPQDSLRTGFDQFVTGDSLPSASRNTGNANLQNAERIESFKLIKRNIEYKEQLTVAVWMMAFIAVMFTTAQSWNPN
jgi:hypothetical protein